MSRLEKFNLPSLAGITQTDEMELWSLGEKKTAIFAVLPDNDSSFNFIVGIKRAGDIFREALRRQKQA